MWWQRKNLERRVSHTASLTHQGLERTKQDQYNDDPKAFEPAIVSIDKFCRAHPKLGPADGAISYLNELIKN